MSALARWLEDVTGIAPRDLSLFETALTHASRSGANYERLEFLGDRVLGLAIADWLLEVHPDEAEGQLAHRLNALVSRETCADVARAVGVGAHLRLGKQALDDGVHDSDNVLGDVTEALIGALYLDAGYEPACSFVRQAWGDRVDRLSAPPKHPKAELQEWTAAAKRKPPVYALLERQGPDHAPRFLVEVTIKGMGSATGEGLSKQEAEKAAAAAMLERLG